MFYCGYLPDHFCLILSFFVFAVYCSRWPINICQWLWFYQLLYCSFYNNSYCCNQKAAVDLLDQVTTFLGGELFHRLNTCSYVFLVSFKELCYSFLKVHQQLSTNCASPLVKKYRKIAHSTNPLPKQVRFSLLQFPKIVTVVMMTATARNIRQRKQR